MMLNGNLSEMIKLSFHREQFMQVDSPILLHCKFRMTAADFFTVNSD